MPETKLLQGHIPIDEYRKLSHVALRADSSRAEILRVMVSEFIRHFESIHGPIILEDVRLEELTNGK